MVATDYIGQTLNDKYELIRLLGEGGMGAVYLGQHMMIGRHVAVKFLHSDLISHEEVVKRFYQEARAAASISHKNIIDVMDVGVTPNGEPYLVMEYLEGEGLASLLERNTRVDLATAFGIMEPMLLALKAAHEKGIVHRDLKPENIFLKHQKDEAPEIKLIDFGISKVTKSGDQTKLTQDGSMLGTPAYMSPEQARGSADVDRRTDIYAAGVILYEMLTGGRPYVGEQYNELLVNMLTTDPRPPKEVYADFPDVAGPIIDRAMAKDANERYQNTDEMLEAIRESSTFEDRRKNLTLLSPAMKKTSYAVGDLGTEIVGNTDLAAELFSRTVPKSAPGWWLAIVNNKIVRKVADRAKEKLTGPQHRLYKGLTGLGVALLFGLFVTGLCMGDGDEHDGVLITIEGVPKKARIFYNDSLVPMNPFRVEQGQTLVPLRVEVPGRRKFKISIIPSSNQVVNVPRKKVTKQPVAKESKKAAPKKIESTKTESVKTESEKAESTEKTTKKRRRRFRWPWKRNR